MKNGKKMKRELEFFSMFLYNRLRNIEKKRGMILWQK